MVNISWQERAIEATGGNGTMFGAVVLAVLGRTPTKPPAFGLGAVITEDGIVCCEMLNRHGKCGTAQVGKVEEVVREFRVLADRLKLSDTERIAMFDEVRKWIRKDWRANTQLF